ncbi:hypothetical protein C7U92_21775 [Bradyrhizobium sp. WBOS7]|uniref:Uncharacterized protein n=1 Tax=Bradyrhizobium betae TaxID=244734 RepID=A0AAE9SNF3_9BRAD|nr:MULTISPECIES: hypothetical protein [Bradyrhizobium]MDD1574881.1 hypothetical protein [Bradyrhizobium sp. WBOS1]UUO33768.1 hypothetical protein DCK84_03720 [Bradyrhizobium sp. WBOS01]MDD1529918.1 hypothetical protein [Bradyrhizobium sp. WBOS2]MDD1579326.1 hypothetical protein [Bradyrhizobium sp. WBOS7]MDD1604648.1 hypothetical protein [Bradyrhizobium sp. WBOS16]
MRGAFTHLVHLLLASLVCVLGAALLTYAVDPLQLFRPSRLAFYSDDTRVQNAGLIRSQSFDTAFMGTSLAIHFRQSDIDRALGVHSLKLAMTGSNSRQQGFVLEQAIGRGARRVIWAMDDFIFIDAADIESDPYLSVDLYRGSAKGIASYLFSAAMAKESLFALLRSVPPLRPPLTRAAPFLPVKFALPDVDDIYALPRDFDVAREYNAKKTLAAFTYITNPTRSRFLGEGYDDEVMVRHFEQDALGLIARHPDVTFDVYFPPYSILQFVAMREASPATLKTVTDLTAVIARRLTQLPNVRLHDFRAIKEVTHDLDNYGDVIHHSPVVDAMVLRWLANGTYRVDAKAPLASLEQLRAQVEAYRLER